MQGGSCRLWGTWIAADRQAEAAGNRICWDPASLEGEREGKKKGEREGGEGEK